MLAHLNSKEIKEMRRKDTIQFMGGKANNILAENMYFTDYIKTQFQKNRINLMRSSSRITPKKIKLKT